MAIISIMITQHIHLCTHAHIYTCITEQLVYAVIKHDSKLVLISNKLVPYLTCTFRTENKGQNYEG